MSDGYSDCARRERLEKEKKRSGNLASPYLATDGRVIRQGDVVTVFARNPGTVKYTGGLWVVELDAAVITADGIRHPVTWPLSECGNVAIR